MMLDNGAFFKRERNLLQHPLRVAYKAVHSFLLKALHSVVCPSSVRELFPTDPRTKSRGGVFGKNYGICWIQIKGRNLRKKTQAATRNLFFRLLRRGLWVRFPGASLTQVTPQLF